MKPTYKLCLCSVMGLLLADNLAAQSLPTEWQADMEQIKEWITEDPEQAAEIVKDLLHGKNKKNVDLIVAVSRTYLDAGLPDEAATYLELARKANPQASQVYLLEGDIALTRHEVGLACQAYEQAIYFDPACREAYLGYARAYKTANPSEAIAKLRRLKELHPDCLEADRELAALYYASDRFPEAVEAYAAFIDTPLATEDDRAKYAFALFLNRDFEQSLSVVQRGLQDNGRSAALNRLAMYDYTELKRYEEAERAADALFNASDLAKPTYLDYRYYADLLVALKQYQRSVAAYRSYYAASGQGEPAPEELFRLGRLYYGEGASRDTLSLSAAAREEALLVADSLFATLSLRVPDSYLGDFWRARTRATLDPETTEGWAKPYYERAATLLQAKEDAGEYLPQLTECYSYLGYYYLLQSDYAASKEYWNKILQFDPENDVARRALEGIP